MGPDDHVCLCFRVSKRKVVNYCRHSKPAVPSLISECLGAGTGCGWCVPYLKSLHQQVQKGIENPDLPINPQTYAQSRASYRITGTRPPTPGTASAPGNSPGSSPGSANLKKSDS